MVWMTEDLETCKEFVNFQICNEPHISQTKMTIQPEPQIPANHIIYDANNT